MHKLNFTSLLVVLSLRVKVSYCSRGLLDALYQVKCLTTIYHLDKSHVLLSSKSVSVINSKSGLLSMFL